jgi:5'-nucleotidase
MRILLSNDDGIHARGLTALREALAPLCELWVCAPSSQQSATSHSLTLHTILRRHQLDERVFSVDGTPADSVLMAINGFMADSPPDLVISGINHGPNMGEDVHYSGTVAAAIEAAILGVPAIAVSVVGFRDLRFDAAANYLAKLVSEDPERLRAKGTLLNINVPNCSYDELTGVSVTRQGSRYYGDVILRKTDPREQDYYWIGGEEPTWLEEEDSDFFAVHRQNRVSVTPLSLDLTDHERLAKLSGWNESSS